MTSDATEDALRSSAAACGPRRYPKTRTTSMCVITLHALLVALAQATYAENGIAQPQEALVEQGYFPFPSLTGWSRLGEYQSNRIDEIPGDETTIVGYEKDGIHSIVSKIGPDPYGYWYHDPLQNKSWGVRYDRDNDGNYEVRGVVGASEVVIDPRSYGVDSKQGVDQPSDIESHR